MFDVFVADLRCPNCGSMASVNDNTGMQTHIRVDADGSALPVGYELDPFDLQTDKIVGNGYSIVNTPEAGKPIRLLDIWTCPTCHTEQWAMIAIDQNRIQLVEAINLDRLSLQSANFISDVNAEILAEQMPNRGDSVVETLRRNLP
jgi:RNA polymerase subunit RPABC4/transcription elongation factor Spt4